MVAIRDILHPNNALHNRGLVINHRNVGFNALLLGLHIHELVFGVIFTFVLAMRLGLGIFILAGLTWLIVAYIRKRYNTWQIIGYFYKKYLLQPKYFPYSEDLQAFEEFLNQSSSTSTNNKKGRAPKS